MLRATLASPEMAAAPPLPAPRVREPLQILDCEYYLVKTDILSRTMWFSSDTHALGGMQPLRVERVKERCV